MRSKIIFGLAAVLLLLTLLPGAAVAQTPALDIPAGVQRAAAPYIAALLEHAEHHEDPGAHLAMMIEMLNTLADRLPAGVFLDVLRILAQLDEEDHMAFHHAVMESDLLDQGPGLVIAFAQQLLID
jgi:hypothetical protein